MSSGAVSSMSLAVVKDILRGAAMEKVVTWIQTVTILAPMLAPVAGGGLLLLTDWRGIFWCLAGCGLLALAGGLALRETRARPRRAPSSMPWGGFSWFCARRASVRPCCYSRP